MLAPSRVCAVVARTRHKMLQVELREAVARGAKFIEVRLDFLQKAVDYKRLQPSKACPWMATFRLPADGGRFAGTEAERQTLLRQAIVSGLFEWIDLETDIADSVRRFGTVKRVVSYHNMKETPADLDAIYDRMLKQDADVVKIAVLANTPDDCQRIIALQKRAPKPTIAFGMGELGFFTRFTCLKFGAPWTYAAFNPERGLAPGQPSLDQFRTVYPVHGLNPESKVFGLFGDPVAQSYSPILHNHMFRRNRVDAIYLPFKVPDGQLPAMVAAMKEMPLSGASVTIPHKEAAAALAADRESTVKEVGSANTLIPKPDGGFFAVNTDYPAAIESIRSYLDERAREQGQAAPEFHQLFALVLGAGGAARAVAYALHKAGAHVTISARTQDRAEKLAAELGCKFCPWAARHSPNRVDLIVNCTPIGMYPNVNESPLHASFLRPGLVVFDTVYSPEHTLLTREAEARGCGVITGLDMFVRQAAKQFELFTGIEPKLDDMRELMRKAMSPLTRAMDEEAAKSGGMGVVAPPKEEEDSDDDSDPDTDLENGK
jgi:3-dehydroquinate dehydratase/shikimate dehydrogenase